MLIMAERDSNSRISKETLRMEGYREKHSEDGPIFYNW